MGQKSANENETKPVDKKGLFRRIKSAFSKKLSIDEESERLIESIERTGGDISSDKREMLVKVASFDSLTIGDVMVPRADIIAVEVDTKLGELVGLLAEHQHSRLPIYRENLDNPVGFIHVKDILELLIPDENGNIKGSYDDEPLNKLKRELVYVPISMRLPNLLLQMRALRCHMALVVDEYGGTDGLVTIEDLVEEIIGDIDDEYDSEETNKLIARGNNQWEVDAKLELAEFEEKTQIDLGLDIFEEEIDTFGGLAFTMIGRIPPRGEIISHSSGIELEILDADPRKIKRIIVRILDSKKATDI